MKAIVCRKYGPPEVLQIREVARPAPEDNEVLVKVYAATVNRTDCATLKARPFFMRLITGMLRPKRQITGTEFA
ncbi:MAG: NAD(P)-dependent alcohol dehydrogenase, partial [Dehalococcoidia bacterium]